MQAGPLSLCTSKIAQEPERAKEERGREREREGPATTLLCVGRGIRVGARGLLGGKVMAKGERAGLKWFAGELREGLWRDFLWM